MNRIGRIVVVVLLAGALGAVIAVKKSREASPAILEARVEKVVAGSIENAVKPPEEPKAVPRLLELGSDKCIPCKMMAPILDELRKEYEGQLQVAFVDVWQSPTAGDQYGVRVIPTQIFFDGAGKELFRHTGFYPKEELLAKWKELGFSLEKRGQ